jgi:hypothetical protein
MRLSRLVFCGLSCLSLAAVGCGSSEGDDQPSQPKQAKLVQVTLDYPKNVKRDVVAVLGLLTPRNATVEVDGERVAATGGEFTYRAHLHKGENEFALTADAPGWQANSEQLTIQRSLTEAEIAEQERVRAEREARREARRAEAEARRQAAVEAKRQEFINSAETIPYAQLQKDPNAYVGKKVVFRGRIFQIQQEGNRGIMLLSVTDEGYDLWTDEVWVNYTGKVSGAEEDFLTVYGIITGQKTFETQAGGSRYVPEIDEVYIVEG